MSGEHLFQQMCQGKLEFESEHYCRFEEKRQHLCREYLEHEATVRGSTVSREVEAEVNSHL